ncbi:MAG: AI-2E family transporter [Bacteroidota bacterium]|nr:AI-2E family transporter [Bacteroidota bacterium]
MESTPKKHQTIQHVTFLVFLIFLVYVILKHLAFMHGALLGSLTLFILSIGSHKYLTIKKKWKKSYATVFILITTFLLILLPFYFTITFIVQQIQPLIENPEPIINGLKTINNYLASRFDVSLLSPEIMSKVGGMLQNYLPQILSSSLNVISNLLLIYFILWFMLNNIRPIEKWIKNNSPFKLKNTLFIYKEFGLSVKSNAIGVYILAIVQAIVAIVGYYIFGVQEALVWGLITGVASVIPIVGTMAIWMPLSIYSMATGDIGIGVGIFLYGLLIIGSSDNVFRFILQKKLAETHPLITIIGVLFGISFMGFWGLVYGPVIIILLITLYKIYLKEYVKTEDKI